MCSPCMYAVHRVHGWYHEGQKTASEPLELELQAGVSNHMGAGNWTHILEGQQVFPGTEPQALKQHNSYENEKWAPRQLLNAPNSE